MNKYILSLRTALATIAIIFFSVGMSAQKTYVVAVGLDRYKYPEIAPELRCSANDVNAVSHFFHNYNGSDVFMVLNENATRKHILSVLKKQFGKSTVNDEILFVFSGHGVEGGFTSYDISREEDLITFEEVQTIMKAAKAKRKLVIADACHSGGLNFNRSTRTNHNSNNHKKTDVMFYTSCRPTESSFECPNKRNSFFIDKVLTGFRGEADANNDKKVTARELFNYVNPYVINETFGMQHPQMWGNFDDDMIIVKVKK